MRFLSLMAAVVALTACSDSSTETKAPAPEKPLDPITGRQAFQYTYPAARGWAQDAEPVLVRSINLDEVKSAGGRAGAWEVSFVSMSRGAAKVYTWSAIEGQGSLHKGVFGGPEQSWREGSQERPFMAAAFRIDTPEALKTAVSNSAEYLDTPGKKPPVTFWLESTPRFPNPTWRVLWGASVGSAEHQVFIDASMGTILGKQ
jgi:hypothetical protein